ncbi:MAG: hypothetical protein AB1634_09800 [Thermodesulfobacteriota bacterium]
MTPPGWIRTGLLTVLLALCSHQAVQAGTLAITGRPLEIRADEYGRLGVYRWQGEALVQQYFRGDDGTGTALFLNGTALPFYSHDTPQLTPISHSQPDPGTIVTEVMAGDTGVHVTLTLSYVEGSAYYRLIWQISNQGTEAYTDLALLHGGDTYFGGDDSSRGHWDEGLKMVYLDNPDPGITGIMGLYGGHDSPADHYYEAHYGSVWTAIEQGSLPDTVNESYLDAGYALKWERPALLPGETWTVVAFEKWTEAGFIQVIAPADQTGDPGQEMTYSFVLQSFLAAEDSFDLSVTSAGGWPVSLPAGTVVTIPGLESTTVEVTLAIPEAAAPGATDALTLTATSRTDPQLTNSDTVTTQVSVTPSAVSHTWVADVDKNGTVDVADYHLAALPALAPDQPDPLAVFGGAAPYDPAALRLFTYDNPAGAYTEYPALPAAAPGNGYWLITAADRQTAATGQPIPADVPFAVPLAPGWNVVGYPFILQGPWQGVKVRVDDGEGPVDYLVDDPANVWVEHNAWGYDQGYFAVDTDTGVVKPWEAYWVRNMGTEPVALLFPPLAVAGAPVAAAPAAFRGGAAPGQGKVGLAFSLREQGTSLVDRTLFLGLAAEARSGPDVLDCLAPPPVSTQAPRLVVDHQDWPERPGLYAVDVRPARRAATVFRLSLHAPARPSATTYLLQWTGGQTLPRGLGSVLVDLDSGRAHRLGRDGQCAVVLPAGRASCQLAVIMARGLPRF